MSFKAVPLATNYFNFYLFQKVFISLLPLKNSTGYRLHALSFSVFLCLSGSLLYYKYSKPTLLACIISEKSDIIFNFPLLLEELFSIFFYKFFKFFTINFLLFEIYIYMQFCSILLCYVVFELPGCICGLVSNITQGEILSHCCLIYFFSFFSSMLPLFVCYAFQHCLEYDTLFFPPLLSGCFALFFSFGDFYLHMKLRLFHSVLSI